MPRKKRLTPKDKKIQTLESLVHSLTAERDSFKERAQGWQKKSDDNAALVIAAKAERDEVQNIHENMKREIESLYYSVRDYGQPELPRYITNGNRHQESTKLPERVPNTPEKQLGIIQGVLHGIANGFRTGKTKEPVNGYAMRDMLDRY